MSRNKSESAIKYYSTHGGTLPNGNEEEDVGAQTEPVHAAPESSTELGYASDVCDYNMGEMAKSQGAPTTMLGGRGFLIQPADNLNRQLSNSKNDGSYIQQWKPNSLVSSYAKPMSPSIESSLYDRRQRLIQKRAKIFKSSENLCPSSPKPWAVYNKDNNTQRSITPNLRASSVHNLTEHFDSPNNVEPISYHAVQSSSRQLKKHQPHYQAPQCFNNDINANDFNIANNTNTLFISKV